MNTMDRLKVSLAEAGWKFHQQEKRTFDITGVWWTAWKMILDVPGYKTLLIEPSHYETNESSAIEISMYGYLDEKLHTVSMRGFTPDEIMPNMQRIARTLAAAFVAAEKEWSK